MGTPSGANNLTGSITRTLERLLGDKTTFSVFSTPANRTITYHRFSTWLTTSSMSAYIRASTSDSRTTSGEDKVLM